MNMKQSAARWTAFTIRILAVSILGLAGAGLYANALVSRAVEKRTAAPDSCPSPSADFSKKERKTMTTAVQKGIIPPIDSALPIKVETATFGLG